MIPAGRPHQSMRGTGFVGVPPEIGTVHGAERSRVEVISDLRSSPDQSQGPFWQFDGETAEEK